MAALDEANAVRAVDAGFADGFAHPRASRIGDGARSHAASVRKGNFPILSITPRRHHRGAGFDRGTRARRIYRAQYGEARVINLAVGIDKAAARFFEW